jgi:hypothetical protein
MSALFAVAMIAAVVLGLWASVSGPEDAASRRLARLRLVDSVGGPEAVAEMTRLYGEGVVSGYVAHYEGSAGRAVLHVGRTGSEGAAAALVGRLEDRMAGGWEGFTGVEPREVEGVRVLSALGGEGRQYFWQARELVVWLGFDREYPAGLAAAVGALH